MYATPSKSTATGRLIRGTTAAIRCLPALAALLACTLSACGGSNGSDGSNGPFPTYPITGTITSAVTGQPLVNVTVNLSGSLSGSTTTDASGNYHFGRLPVGYYTVAAVLPHATLTPASRNVTITDSNLAGQDFTAAQIATVAADITFLPASFSSADQLRASIVVAGSDLAFTDSSATPLKRLAPSTGALTSLATRFGRAESVVLHGDVVYWVDGGQLNRTALNGTTTVLARGTRDEAAGVTADLVVDDTSAYWVNTVASSTCSPACTWIIRRVPLDGSAPVTVAIAQRRVVALAADATRLYWEESMLEPVTPGCQCGSGVKSVPKSGGAVLVLVDGLLNGSLPAPGPGVVPASWLPTGGLAVTATQVLFGVTSGNYQVQAVPLGGGVLTSLATVPTTDTYALNAIRGLATDGTRAYWIDSAAQTLDVVPLVGGSVAALASGLALPGDLNVPVSLALGATAAYWTEPGAYTGCCLRTGAGRIRQVPLGGGAAVTFVSGLDAPSALAVDAANLVWAELWRVARAAPDGSSATTIASGISGNLVRIAVDGTSVYILDGDLIKTVPLAGGAVQKLAPAHGGSISDLAAQNMDIATDGQTVYWSVNGSSAAVQKVPTSGGAVTTLVPGPLGPLTQDCYWRLAVDAHNVYWSAGSTTHPVGCVVNRVGIDGGAVTTLVDQAYLRDFVIDASSLYFSELSSNPGSIRRVALTGGPVTTIATETAWVLAGTNTMLYWIDPSNAVVRALAKSAPSTVVTLPFSLAMDPHSAAEALTPSAEGLYVTETPVGRIDRLY